MHFSQTQLLVVFKLEIKVFIKYFKVCLSVLLAVAHSAPQRAGPLTPLVGDAVATPRGYRPLSLEGFSEDLNQDGFVDPIAPAAPVVYTAPVVHAAPAVYGYPYGLHHGLGYGLGYPYGFLPHVVAAPAAAPAAEEADAAEATGVVDA